MDFIDHIHGPKDLPNENFRIQSKVDVYKGSALIGLEYTVEMYYLDSREFIYHCVLCNKDVSNIWAHWTSYVHRLRYLERHYPTVLRQYRIDDSVAKPFKKSKMIVQIMAEAIEAFHGRLQVITMTVQEFRSNEKRYTENIKKSFHFDEQFGPNFLNLVEHKLFDEKTDHNLSAARTMPQEQDSILHHKFVVDNSSAVLRYKWEEYRNLLREKLEQLELIQREYEKSPESHPLYSDEWDMFWVRRYKELKFENVDPKTYDYKPEWVVFWSGRMKELFADEVENAKKRIKADLDLPEDAEELVLVAEHSPKNVSPHIEDVNFHPTYESVYSHHSRTHSRSPSPHRREQHFHGTRSRSRSPLGASIGFQETGNKSYLPAACYDDMKRTENGRNVNIKASLNHYGSADSQIYEDAKRQDSPDESRSLLDINSLRGSFNPRSEEHHFVDSHRERIKPHFHHREWEEKNKLATRRRFEDDVPHRRNTYNIDAGRADHSRFEGDLYKWTSNKQQRNVEEAAAYKRTSKKERNVEEAPVVHDQIQTLAVIDRGVNDGCIPQHQWKRLETPLTRALVEVLKRNHGPVAQYRDAGWFQGRVKLIAFKDQRSPFLYKEALKSLGEIWPSARLDLVDLFQVPNRPRTFAKLPAMPSRPNEILQLIQKSNPDLHANNWKILKVSFEKGGYRQATMTINGKSMALLDARNWIIRYGDRTIRLRIYHEDARDIEKNLN